LAEALRVQGELGLGTERSETTRLAARARVALALAAAAPSLAYGAGGGTGGDADARTPTAYVEASEGYSVYESKMVASNDTGTTLRYGFGVWAGASHSVGMLLERESSAFTFKLNSSSIAVNWQDVAMRCRWGPLYAGALISTSSWVVKAPPLDATGKPTVGATPVEFIDIQTTGYGLQTGLSLPIGKSGSVFAEVKDVPSGVVLAQEPEAGVAPPKTTMGARTEFELGGALALTKSLEATAGFRDRSYQLTVGGTAYKEQLNTTYLGLQANFYF
jgi:hypothetical protein